VGVEGLSDQVTLREMDERNAEEAMWFPEVFRQREGTERETHEGCLTVDLSPFAILWIDSV
jgi:hypothetical protein